MIFFLFIFLNFFLLIHGDCLEFSNDSLINQCLIIQSKIQDFDYYYPECLQCRIETLIKPGNIYLEDNNQCLTIELQCIQLKFQTKELFEDFFQFHQYFLSELFFQNNGIDQNTLHIIINENSFEEINADYIEKNFLLEYQVYRVLFFEVHIKNQYIKINRNLINITRLAMKLIIICEENNKFSTTIYIVYNRNIILESKEDLCSTILVPSLTSISSTSITMVSSTTNVVLSISNKKSKNIVLITVLLTGFLLSSMTGLTYYCFKHLKHRYKRLSKTIDTTSELSISQDPTPLTPNETPKLSLKPQRSRRGMRAIQLLEDDV